ncbi:MAG: hypothetical protein HYV07_28505 [Deltaproteobacteria bacterium]|nr:hypothetical protein [Deltaproteobacteria bacterium]
MRARGNIVQVRVWLIAGLAALHCSEDSQSELLFPTVPEHRHAIVVVRPPGAPPEVYSIPLEGPRVSPEALSVPFEDGLELTLLLYRASAEELLDLSVGTLRQAPRGALYTRGLPLDEDEVDAAYVAVAVRGVALTWSPLSEQDLPARSLDQLRFEDPGRFRGCARLDRTIVETEIQNHLTFATRLDDGTYLVGTELTNLDRPGDERKVIAKVQEDSVTGFELTELSFPEGVPQGSLVTRGSEIYAAGLGGAIWKVHLDGTALTGELFASSPSAEEIRWMASSPEGTPLELVTVGLGGAVERFDGASWTELARLPIERRDQAGLARADDGTLFVISTLSDRLLEIQGGLAEQVMGPGGDGVSYSLVSQVEGFGFVLGAANGGAMYRRTERLWESLGDSGFELPVYAAVPFGDGFIYGGQGPVLGHRRGEAGFCDLSIMAQAAHTTRFFMQFTDEIVAAGDVPFTSGRLPITVFRPRTE